MGEKVEKDFSSRIRENRKVLLFIVYVAMLLDTCLMTVVGYHLRIGYTVPMFTGFIILFSSTVLYAFGDAYWVLLVARTFQGIGSAFTNAAGLGMIAEAYPDNKERGKAMGIVIGGSGLGSLIGTPYGGVMYQLAGKEITFLILALFVFADGGSLAVGTSGLALTEALLPLWMMSTMQTSTSITGLSFLPGGIAHQIGANIMAYVSHRVGRWLCALTGLILCGVGLVATTFATGPLFLIPCMAAVGFATAMVDVSMSLEMANLVDIRHPGVYGGVYGIAEAALCFSFLAGPYIGGAGASKLGFAGMLYVAAGSYIFYAPLNVFLRNPPKKLIQSSDDENISGAG